MSTELSTDEIIVFWEFERVGSPEQPQTKARLVLSGPSTETLDVGIFPGTGVDTRTISADYSRGGSVLGAIFWQGNESIEVAIDVTTSNTLLIKHRSSSKDGGTTDWQPRNVIPLPGKVHVRAGEYVDPYRRP
jgi:hypothetical protein